MKHALMALALPVLLAGSTSVGLQVGSLPEPGGNTLEGITLGQQRAELEPPLAMTEMTPRAEGDGLRYTWNAPFRLDLPRPMAGGSLLRRLEVVFRDDRVAVVRASYGSEAHLTRIGQGLTERYGEPAEVRAGPAREITGNSGEVLFLWVQLWTWEWEGVRFKVRADHYTETKDPLAPGRYTFNFEIESRSSD